MSMCACLEHESLIFFFSRTNESDRVFKKFLSKQFSF